MSVAAESDSGEQTRPARIVRFICHPPLATCHS